MTTNLPATTTPKPKSILMAVATRYQMEPEAFERTLRGTVFPGNGTREEFAAFLVVAERYKLDPITRQIYAFPKKGGGIVPVVGIDGWIHLVNQHPQMNGMEFEYDSDEKGQPISCTCRIFRKDRAMPTVVTEFYDECVRNSEPWKMKRRMLRHKALMQCARYAFGFSGLYDEDEARDIANNPDAPIPPPPPPPPGAVAERDAGKVEDAVIVEPEKAEPEKTANTDTAGGDDGFEFDQWIEEVQDAFATCQTEADVDQTHEVFGDTVAADLNRDEAERYQGLHEAALTRVTDAARAAAAPEKPQEPTQPEEPAPAAPPPTKAKPAPAATATLQDDDEDDTSEHTGTAYLTRGRAVLAARDCSHEAITSFWNDTKAERMQLKKDGNLSADDIAALRADIDRTWAEIESAMAKPTDPTEPEMSDLDKRIAAFDAEYRAKVAAITSVTELHVYVDSTLPTRNGFGLDSQADPRIKAWRQLKVDRQNVLNGIA